MASYLKTVPAAPSWLPKPRGGGDKFKITLWLDPGTYFLLMQRSAELAAGEISIHKWIKKALHIDGAAEKVQEVDGRTAMPTTLAISHRIHQLDRDRKQLAARRRKQPRKVAA